MTNVTCFRLYPTEVLALSLEFFLLLNSNHDFEFFIFHMRCEFDTQQPWELRKK